MPERPNEHSAGPDAVYGPGGPERPESRERSGASRGPGAPGDAAGPPRHHGSTDRQQDGDGRAKPNGDVPPARTAIDLDRPWALHPQVSMRPEPFGALLYHFGTRRLSFLKDRRLVEVIRRLPDAPSARAACDGCGISTDELPRFRAALTTLARSAMLVETT
ncbi:mycofactocin biosynthesis chaperone MftB [Yinghuangia sp. YIM S10712]|uniref:mycofactocin biosynthesis chaperone MftB n=1 Tax=Yinghuangia sp. YIM S10712 TaxID=3436930 RepID=UPI003F538EB6